MTRIDETRAGLQHDLVVLLNPRGYRLESQGPHQFTLIRPAIPVFKAGLALVVFGLLMTLGGGWYVGVPTSLAGAALAIFRLPGQVTAHLTEDQGDLRVKTEGRNEAGLDSAISKYG